MAEDEMVGSHHQLSGKEFEQALGDGGQGNLVCCRAWDHQEPDMTERLNDNKRENSIHVPVLEAQ